MIVRTNLRPSGAKRVETGKARRMLPQADRRKAASQVAGSNPVGHTKLKAAF